MNKMLRTKKSGSALPLVMLVLVILFTLGVGLLSISLNRRIFTIRTASKMRARAAADAGLAKALFEMNEKLKDKSWDGSTIPIVTNANLPNCDDVFSYTVTGNLLTGYTIESIGQSNNATKRITSLLKLTGPFEYSIFSDARIDIANSGTVTGYNYGPNGGKMKVATNSGRSDSIRLRSLSTIDGDIMVGRGADPDAVIDLKIGAIITGTTYAIREKIPRIPVSVPNWLDSLPTGATIRNSTVINASGKYRGINLKKNNIITIDGAVSLYIIDDITLGNSAEIQIDDTNPNASLTLYMGGDIEGKNSSNFNNKTKDPRKLKMYGLDSCRRLRFKNSSDFYGAIYAPKANVTFDNSADAYGSVIANKFHQRNSGTFNYDASLRNVTVKDEAVRFTIQRWSE